jgi:hypothetical protein
MGPTRRTLLHAAGSTTLVGLVGCLDRFRSGQIAVRVDNRDDRRHAVDVEFLDGGELVTEERFEIDAETERTYENVVAAGQYTVDVTLDGETHTAVDFTMQGCTDNTLFVSVSEAAVVDAGVLDEC